MTTAACDSFVPPTLPFQESLSLRLPDANCKLVVSNPVLDPTLWTEYLEGAIRSYTKHGVERTLNIDAIADGADTWLFFAAVDSVGDVVGGARVVGPLWSADDSHAVIEWEGSPGAVAVRKMIDDRVPFGVVEVKTAWADSASRHRDAIATALARTALPIMALLGVQFVMATAAAHVLDRWRASGGVVAATIPAVAYPDERYRTKMMWWDRSTMANHADPKQLSRMYKETGELMRDAEALGGIGMASAGRGR
ncbi:hypothetical protein [Mycobacterium sp. TY815]|uniref:hypothetical protein n=1 Tax=Mycobacterium sp. TY815 TaxID=3050581 RepID=UPI0027408F2A|nr:hypothetical protein [Mycobacterium sp. TY815]MDP7705043.1 hypothetical protein [Mycobacterium sp. TY815]